MTEQDARTLVAVTAWLNIAVGTVHALLTVALLVAGVVLRPRTQAFLAGFPEIASLISMAATLTGLLVVLILALSIAEICAAAFLFRHNEHARRWSVGIGICNLFHAPLGTIVGAFTLWTLTRPTVRQLCGTRSVFT